MRAHFQGYVCWDFPDVTDPGLIPKKGSPDDHRNPTRRTQDRPPSSAAPDRNELLGHARRGVQSLTSSDGWRRYLRAMTTLRTYLEWQ